MALLDRILELLGTNRTRMQWKLRAWRRAWDRRVGAARNRSQALTYQHQTCPACSHPASSDERTCSRCGEPLAGAGMQRLQRLIALVWPSDRPVVATLLGAAIIATYAATVLWSRQLGMPLGLSPHPYALDRFGDVSVADLDAGEWWRLITSAYLHVDPLHIAFNLLSLWTVATFLEDVLGKAKTLALYTALAITSSLTSYAHYAWTTGFGSSAGASGAICGLIGVAIGFTLRRRNVARHLASRYVMWAVWIAVLTFSGMPIDHFGHIGGLVPGFAIGLVIRRRSDTGPHARRAWTVAALLALAATVAAFGLAAATPRPLPTDGIESSP